MKLMKILTTLLVFIGLLGACAIDTEGTLVPTVMSIVGIGGAALTYFLYWVDVK